MSEELKPCPFCGSEKDACVVRDSWDTQWKVTCQKCGASTRFRLERADAVLDWNARAPAAELAALRARVAELELENSRLRTPLRPIVDRVHNALGCAEQSDDESLPEMVETWVREHREKIAELEREVELLRGVKRALAPRAEVKP